MTPSDRRLILYGVCAACVALAAWAHLRGVPALRSARKLEQGVAELEEERTGAPPAANPAALEADVASLEAERRALRHAAGDGSADAPADPGGLEETLARLAEAHGLLVDVLQTGDPGARGAARVRSARDADTGDDGYYARPRGGRPRAAGGVRAGDRSVVLRGTFGDLRAFLADLEATPDPPDVRRLVVANLGAGVYPLRIELEVAP